LIAALSKSKISPAEQNEIKDKAKIAVEAIHILIG
jgi:hypothetical protein